MKSSTIQAGDRVKYSAKFLRSIGCQTGPICFMQGIVQSTRSYGQNFIVAAVVWDDDREDGSSVNVANLVRVKDMGLESVL